jgi:hypothetical protein
MKISPDKQNAARRIKMITNKIAKVDDKVCAKCSQLWRDECRAYHVSQSEEEYKSRFTGGEPTCFDKDEKEKEK